MVLPPRGVKYSLYKARKNLWGGNDRNALKSSNRFFWVLESC